MPAPSSRDCPVYGLLYVNKPLTVQVSYVCCTGVRACHRRDFLSSKNSLRSCGYRLVNLLRRCSSSRNQISERVIVDEIRVKPLKYTGQVLYEQFHWRTLSSVTLFLSSFVIGGRSIICAGRSLKMEPAVLAPYKTRFR